MPLSKQHMDSREIEFSFFDAVDGKTLPEDELKGGLSARQAILMATGLSLGEVGCAMSHIRIYEMMVAKRIECCIVLEDDIYLHCHFKAIIAGHIGMSV